MNIFYTLKEPLRWDTVCYQMYGNVDMVPLIVQANPLINIYTIIPAGTVLSIPVIKEDAIVNADLLPPWKR